MAQKSMRRAFELLGEAIGIRRRCRWERNIKHSSHLKVFLVSIVYA